MCVQTKAPFYVVRFFPSVTMVSCRGTAILVCLVALSAFTPTIVQSHDAIYSTTTSLRGHASAHRQLLAAPTVKEAQVYSSISGFGYKLLLKAYEEATAAGKRDSKGFFLSPTSIYNVMAMALKGAGAFSY